MSRLSTSTCVGCGDSYLFTNTYKGNYCADCHETWSAREPDGGERPKPRPMRSWTVPSVRRIVDEDAPSRYDRE